MEYYEDGILSFISIFADEVSLVRPVDSVLPLHPCIHLVAKKLR
jgi:hypothetical protein